MILLCGIPSESPVARLALALESIGADYRYFNQRRAADCAIEFSIDASGADGVLRLKDETLRLSSIGGVYMRLMDDRILPELDDVPDGAPARRHTRALHDTLYRWVEVADGCIVNRCDPQGSNGAKPYQAQLIAAHGLGVPETLITNDPGAVVAFCTEHDEVIYKSMSGVRSIVKILDEADIARLEHIRWCPVQFQKRVPGVDVRVHVVDQDVFATEIISDVTDYRYASQAGGTAELRARNIPDVLAERCVALTAALGLAFSGIDLRIGPDGAATCFEVNPSPGYSYYEANTGQPIAASLARYMARGLAG